MFINSKTEIASCQQKGKKQGNFTYKIMFWTCKYTKSVCHKHYMFGCECQKKVFAICSYFFYTVANAGGGQSNPWKTGNVTQQMLLSEQDPQLAAVLKQEAQTK